MRILIIAEKLPNNIGGYSMRLFNLIRELSKRHEFTLVTYAYPLDLEFIPSINRYVQHLDVIPLLIPHPAAHMKLYWQVNSWKHALFDARPTRGDMPKPGEMVRAINKWMSAEKYDLIEFNQAYMGRFVPKTDIPKLFHSHGILADDLQRELETADKLTHRIQKWLEWKKMERLERNAIKKSDVCVAVSEQDKEKIVNYHSNACEVVPNGVDTEFFSPDYESNSSSINIVFTGSMSYPPNVDAAIWFGNQIFPLVRTAVPAAKLFLVGWNPPQEIQYLASHPNITVTGFVEDVRPFFKNSAVVVVPLRYGSGTRLKILDAWAMGKAVVSTRLGAAGLRAVHGENILLADEPRQFAEFVLRLLADPVERRRLGEAGRRTLEEHYSWQAISQKMQVAYERATQVSPKSG